MPMRFALPSSILLGLALAGCGGGSPDIETIDNLVTAVEEAGIDCGDVEVRPRRDYAAETARCGRLMDLNVFEDPDDAQLHAGEFLSGGTNSVDVEILVGENWTIVDAGLSTAGRQSYIPKLKEALGGTSHLLEGAG